MPWIRFTKKFNWRPKPSVIIEFKAGRVDFVTRRCAERAIAAKAGVPAPSPRIPSQATSGPLNSESSVPGLIRGS